MQNKRIYSITNIIVLIVTALLFSITYFRKTPVFDKITVQSFLILAGTVLIVHFIKAIRLYFEFYEKKISFDLLIRQYCKVVPVSIIFPAKIGDVFRAYCFGAQIGDYLRAIAVIALDRFVDTLALVTVILGAKFIGNMSLTGVFYVLMTVLILLAIVYLVFPGMSKYWRKYFIKSRATANSLRGLGYMQKLDEVYSELAAVIKGKFLITFVLSLVAWLVEIGSLLVLCNIDYKDKGVELHNYLIGALSGQESNYLYQFICLSVFLMIIVYLTMYISKMVRRKKSE